MLFRVPFDFDPTRTADLLFGGDKAEDAAWTTWHAEATRVAGETYATYRVSRMAPSRRQPR